MHLDGAAGALKRSPGTQRKANINRGRIQGVDGVVQFNPERFVSIQWPSDGNQHLCQIAIDTPVSVFVGVGQRRARNLPADSQMIKLSRYGPQARLHIPQTLTMSQLSKRHAEPLIPTGESAQVEVSAVSRNTCLKLAVGNEVHQLGENHPTL